MRVEDIDVKENDIKIKGLEVEKEELEKGIDDIESKKKYKNQEKEKNEIELDELEKEKNEIELEKKGIENKINNSIDINELEKMDAEIKPVLNKFRVLKNKINIKSEEIEKGRKIIAIYEDGINENIIRKEKIEEEIKEIKVLNTGIKILRKTEELLSLQQELFSLRSVHDSLHGFICDDLTCSGASELDRTTAYNNGVIRYKDEIELIYNIGKETLDKVKKMFNEVVIS